LLVVKLSPHARGARTRCPAAAQRRREGAESRAFAAIRGGTHGANARYGRTH
jgi:acetoin utilization deacetylase AcuC-like enzyme